MARVEFRAEFCIGHPRLFEMCMGPAGIARLQFIQNRSNQGIAVTMDKYINAHAKW